MSRAFAGRNASSRSTIPRGVAGVISELERKVWISERPIAMAARMTKGLKRRLCASGVAASPKSNQGQSLCKVPSRATSMLPNS